MRAGADVSGLGYEEALTHLTGVRGYGPVSARGLLHAALCRGVHRDVFPASADGTRPAVEIRLQRGTATKPDRYWIRTVTITPF